MKRRVNMTISKAEAIDSNRGNKGQWSTFKGEIPDLKWDNIGMVSKYIRINAGKGSVPRHYGTDQILLLTIFKKEAKTIRIFLTTYLKQVYRN